ncbi:probable methyltransferase PMT5 isoform X1 [Tripterygium wilfordii]|uniref:probable methyltransferase PMT5 isoform X1 n=2 Tax=Tripterygium wilfordii TaxID=458696 RepID=UPI0018F858C1|nr:probable methyltransferase PMT5 isoform X1 [Tripterygium wilfordii]XP_038723983.1 probable methyltransferase PMT5 isoform X1 [Tripterygium wilfordii]
MRNPWFNKLYPIVCPRPPFSWFLLCFVCVLALIAILGSTSSNAFDSLTSISVPIRFTNYRRQKEQVAVDYLELKTLSSGAGRLEELGLCGKEKENYVPCYNVTANLLAGFKDGEEFDRHCEVERQEEQCLIRPPKDYKIPLRWPHGRDVIWSGNVKITKDQFLSSGSMTKRLMLLEENQIAFQSVESYYSHIADLITPGNESEFSRAGVRNVLDINCGFGSFGAHLLSLNLMAVCIAAYEATGSQVQLALERGLPAVIGNFISRQLPFPPLSFDMVHCAQCGIIWDKKDGMFLIEVDRLLKPGGYFVLTSPARPHESSLNKKKGSLLIALKEFTENICWEPLAQGDETSIWQKTEHADCASRKQNAAPLCKEGDDAQSYYQPLVSCISGTTSKRWIPIQHRSSSSQLSSVELEFYGVQADDFNENLQFWRSALKNYWSLLTPLIFSDHPKRPGDEDPLPPFNMIRNVMDMNAHYGGLNAAFQEEKKLVWVMNVVPVKARNTLPLIVDQRFAGVLHDWCEPFPTYPQTYDMLHANGLLSHLSSESCSMMDLMLEMDRILRSEGWVVLSDNLGAIEMARMLATQIRWEARVIDPHNGSDQRLLVCQKPFVKK